MPIRTPQHTDISITQSQLSNGHVPEVSVVHVMNLERVTAPKATFPRVRQPINGGSSMALAAQTRNRPVLTTVRIGTKMISWKLTLLVED